MALCLLALGSNLGDRRAILGNACEALRDLPRTHLLRRSRWHRTAPIGGPGGQGQFLNGAVVVQTLLQPEELAAQLHSIESLLGRERMVRWDARVIDIDLLLVDDRQIDLPSLTVPHPRMSFRRFVLEPAAEIAGSWLHPGAGWTLGQLLAQLRNGPRSVEISAEQRPVAAWLAAELGQLLDCPSALSPPSPESSQSTSDPGEQRAVELSVGPVRPEKPVIRTAQTPPDEGGDLQPSIQPDSLYPALVIVVEPNSCESLLASIGVPQEFEKKKIQKNFPDNFPKIKSLETPGPRAILRGEDPETIVQEAVAAIYSAWPDLCVPTRILK